MKVKESHPYQHDISQKLLSYLLQEQARPSVNYKNLLLVGSHHSYESKEAMEFVCQLYEELASELKKVLFQRAKDRDFIDQRTKSLVSSRQDYEISQTIVGLEDETGRVVIGPLRKDYHQADLNAKPIAPLPEYLKGHHVTIFGPPGEAKMCINAMNAFHKKLPEEPLIVSELLKHIDGNLKWGADDEDSKTPLREDLLEGAENLSSCFNDKLSWKDPQNGRIYELAKEDISLPIKRIPGLAIPCLFWFYENQPLPLHLYDFGLHLWHHYKNPKALSFYIPKLENEEEASYIKHMIEKAETLIQKKDPSYAAGSVRVFVVLEHPRAIFRVHEIIANLHPYFAGASLGWHDYLSFTARLFKEDPDYRIPVKADPHIVIKYIKASHDLLVQVLGSYKAVRIGGMYGVLPTNNQITSYSFQVTLKGLMKDVIVQLKRGLDGFWLAHPDFVRISLATVCAFRFWQKGQKKPLEDLIKSLLTKDFANQVLEFAEKEDEKSLDASHASYPFKLMAADLKISDVIANHDPKEIRYNVFQSLQYFADWLCGRGCVALPAQMEEASVRIMDDLATCERSRWEVWHEIYHGRFAVEDFLVIAFEEMAFIRKNLSHELKKVQVPFNEESRKWYEVAMKVMVHLMTSSKPLESASQLLLAFTIPSIRKEKDPWEKARSIDKELFSLDSYIQRFYDYFSICGSKRFAKNMARGLFIDKDLAEKIVFSFSLEEIKEAAFFHGDIGEGAATLDEAAKKEQSLVLDGEKNIRTQLVTLAANYKERFGFKFLVSAKGKTSADLLKILEERYESTLKQEEERARQALWEITASRLNEEFLLEPKVSKLLESYRAKGCLLSLTLPSGYQQDFAFGLAKENYPVTKNTLFQLASLSKPIAACFAIGYFEKKGISLDASVNRLLKQAGSSFQVLSKSKEHKAWEEELSIKDLLSHTGLNMHYVYGQPLDSAMPSCSQLLLAPKEFGYEPVQIIHEPSSKFVYSGGGFLVLEHLLESMEGASIQDLLKSFLKQLGMNHTSFYQKHESGFSYAFGHILGEELKEGPKMFPACAAGALGTCSDMMLFLKALAKAHKDLSGFGPISHETAILMLDGEDKGSISFMGAKMGLGVFVLEAESNRFMVHQGANDGFRSLFIHCYDGSDKGYGFSIFCNADKEGTGFIAELAQIILKIMSLKGIDSLKFQKFCSEEGIKTEELVNKGYKQMLFSAFLPDLPERIFLIEQKTTNHKEPLAYAQVSENAKILFVSNQGFARAENLFSPYPPVFDPGLFGSQGKIMDSWETVRHNSKGFDELICDLQEAALVSYVQISTAFHLGNQVEAVSIEGFNEAKNSWNKLLPKHPLKGHSIQKISLEKSQLLFQKLRIRIFPDGGLSRIWIYDERLSENDRRDFSPKTNSISLFISDPIPQTSKPLGLNYATDQKIIETNWRKASGKNDVDVACSAYGGRVLFASNEHYAPAERVISPFPALDMFDGFESARSRQAAHKETIILSLARSVVIDKVLFDFTFFKNNNPKELSLLGAPADDSEEWSIIFENKKVKAYKGQKLCVSISNQQIFKKLKVEIFPDGGINRIKVFTKLS